MTKLIEDTCVMMILNTARMPLDKNVRKKVYCFVKIYRSVWVVINFYQHTLEGVTVYSLRYVVCCFLSFLGKFMPIRICLDWTEETYSA